MVVEVPRDQWNVDVTAFANGLAVVHRLENREKTRMFLHQPRQGIKVTGPCMQSECAPLWKCRARSLHGSIDIRRWTLGDGGQLLSMRRIHRVEGLSVGGSSPSCVDEGPQT